MARATLCGLSVILLVIASFSLGMRRQEDVEEDHDEYTEDESPEANDGANDLDEEAALGDLEQEDGEEVGYPRSKDPRARPFVRRRRSGR